jgi:hypothetical protein
MDYAKDIKILQWWIESGLKCKWTNSMDITSRNGFPMVLEWWKNLNENSICKQYKLKVSWTSNAMDHARVKKVILRYYNGGKIAV